MASEIDGEAKRIFFEAIDMTAEAAEAFIDGECDTNQRLRAEVYKLLKGHVADGILARSEKDEHVSSEPALPAVKPDKVTLREKLGNGTTGSVYEGYDHQEGRVVAVKILLESDFAQEIRLKHEYRQLLKVNHPNVIDVYRLSFDKAPPFFTMQRLRGSNFEKYLENTRGALHSVEEAASTRQRRLGYLIQLAAGLSALHQQELVHRDVKPANVFLTNEGRVVLLDLGLVKQLTSVQSANTIAGTLPYIAPEQLEGGSITGAADWYAFGVMLFEALVGRLPFEADKLEMLVNKGHLEAPRASAIDPTIPAELDRLCDGLLQRAPGSRPSGREVLETLSALSGLKLSDAVVVSPDRADTFLGRDQPIQRLHAAFAETSGGNTSVCVHVYGASGIGKTAVIEKFLEEVKSTGSPFILLHGRCYKSDAGGDNGLDEFIDQLALFLERVKPQLGTFPLPKHFDQLVRLFPLLRRFEPANRKVIEIVDPREQRQAAFVCLVDLLRRIVDTQPLILWIDDLHWCDPDTVRILNEIVQAQEPVGCLTILSYRDSDLNANPDMELLARPPIDGDDRQAIRSIRLENLSQDDATSLARTLLGCDPGDEHAIRVADNIARESAGNPYYIDELVQYAQIVGGAEPNARVFGIGQVIKRRAGTLPATTLRLLEFVAVAGRPIASDVCKTLEGLEECYLDGQGTLTRAKLLRVTKGPDGDLLDVYHDQVRQAIVSYFSKREIVAYHLLIAQALENSGSKDDERLSIHFEEAGLPEKASEYAIQAAKHAEGALAFDRAARLYARVLSLTTHDGPRRTALLELRANALANAGRGKEAAELFLDLSKGVDPVPRLELRRRACEQYLRSGHILEGLKLTRELLQEVDVRFPEGKYAVLATLVWYRVRLHLWFKRHGFARVEGRLDAAMQTQLDIFWTCALGMSMVDVMRGAAFQAHYTFLAVESGDPYRIALGLAGELALGGVNGSRPEKKTKALFDSAMNCTNQVPNQAQQAYAIALTTSMMGVASYNNGDFQRCLESSRSARDRYAAQCTGADWEITTASCFDLASMFLLGRWSEHARSFPALVQQAETRGDRHGAISLPLVGYTYVHALVADRPGEARSVLDGALEKWPYKEFQMQHGDRLIGEVESYLYEGNGEAALRCLDRDWRAVKKSRLLQIRFYDVMLHALRGRARLARIVQADSRSRPEGVRAIKADARRLIAMGDSWAEGFGHLLNAGIETITGKRPRVAESLQRAQEKFEKVGMDQFTAVVQYRLSQIQNGDVKARLAADTWMKAEKIMNPGRLADMLAPGRWDSPNAGYRMR